MYAPRPSAADAYRDAAVATASPARLLVMLLERLVLDVERALTAQYAGDHQEAGRQLLHAQDIVIELSSSLDPDGFDGGHQLAALYEYLRSQLVQANIRRDASTTSFCLQLSKDLCDTWRTAALTVPVPASAPLPPTGA